MSDINHTITDPGAYHSVIPPNTYAYDAPSVYSPPTPPTHLLAVDEWAELRRAIAKRYQDDGITLEQAILATQQLRGK